MTAIGRRVLPSRPLELLGRDSQPGLFGLALEILLGFVREVVGTDVARRARVNDHVRIGIDTQGVKERGQADAVDALADTLVLKRVLREELDDVAGEFDQLLQVLVRVELEEWHHHDAHHVANLERALAADQDRSALFVAWRQSLGHDVHAVHATDARLVIDIERVVVANLAHSPTYVDLVSAVRPRNAGTN